MTNHNDGITMFADSDYYIGPQDMPSEPDYFEPSFPEFDSDEDEVAYFEAQEDLYEMRELARLDSIHDGDFDWRNGIGQE